MVSQVLGIARLRTASLLIIISNILVIIGISMVFGMIFATPFFINTPILEPLLMNSLPYIALVILGLVVGIVGAVMLRRGFMALKAMSSKYGIGSTGATLQAVAYGILIAALAAMVTAILSLNPLGIAGSYTLYSLGALIELVGAILVAVSFFRLGSDNEDALVKVGGVLFIIVPILGSVMLYVGLGRIIRLKAKQS